jgi:hypothetical protein
MTMDNATLKVAHRIELRLAASYAEYLAECDYDRSQGYRPHYCEHGANMWTDYDNICGACEDGFSMRDGITRRAYAIAQAKELRAKLSRAIAAWREFKELGIGHAVDDDKLFAVLANWSGAETY